MPSSLLLSFLTGADALNYTDATPAEFEARINELEQALQALGPEAFADEYTGYRV